VGGGSGSYYALTNNQFQWQVASLNAIYGSALSAGYQDTNNLSISTNLSRVCDGVIGLRVLAYDVNGVLLTATNTLKNVQTAGVPQFRVAANDNYPTMDPTVTNGLATDEFVFTSNAVPAYVDIELSVLESQAWERLKAIPASSGAQATFLQNQGAAAIHVFRRRIPIHNVDPEVYK
jgi:hypothetical protein